MWTSPARHAYMGTTGHFIDSEWNLKQVLLDFVPFTSSHDGWSLAHAFMDAMKNLNIHTKVCMCSQSHV